MNTPIIGRIYHVVDKATEDVVKVGSTIRTHCTGQHVTEPSEHTKLDGPIYSV